MSQFPKASKKTEAFHSLGTEVGLLDGAFSRFAMECCEHAAQGKIGIEDAEEIWTVFRVARQKAGGRYRPGQSSQKVQLSKLRRIIEIGQKFRMNAWTMLQIASKLYVDEFSDEKYKNKRPFSGEYDCMVHIARQALKLKRTLSEGEIRSNMIKK